MDTALTHARLRSIYAKPLVYHIVYMDETINHTKIIVYWASHMVVSRNLKIVAIKCHFHKARILSATSRTPILDYV